MSRLARYSFYFIISLVCLISNSCTNVINIRHPKRDFLATQSAIKYYETYVVKGTRSGNEIPSESAPYTLGDFSPHWDTGITVSGNDLCYSEFNLSKDYHFLLFPNDNSNVAAVNLQSKYISISNNNYQILNQYIVTYIPAPNYITTYSNIVSSGSIDCQNWNNFSGIVLYSMLSGHHLAAYQFVDGQCHKQALLYDTYQSKEQNISDFLNIMDGVKIGIAFQSNTRSDAIYGGTIEVIEFIYNTTFPIFIIDNEDDDIIISDPLEPIINDTSGGTSNNSSEEAEKSIREYAEDLFDTTSLSLEDKNELDKMLESIMDDCMGIELYKQLVESNRTIRFTFSSEQINSAFSAQQGVMSITLNRSYRSDVLLHEMMHAYQYIHKYNDFHNNLVCCEIEAYIASLAYIERYMDASTFTETYTQYAPKYIEDEILFLAILMPTQSDPLHEGCIPIYNSWFNDATISYSSRRSNKYKTNQPTDGYTFIKSLINLSSNC